MDTTKEQIFLKQSIWITTLLALFGIGFGLFVNSQAIAFDGFYSIFDAFMTISALVVSKLIMRESTERFQYGYWHLEPLVAACNGTILTITCLYAMTSAVYALLEGGNQVNFELAIIYAIISTIVSFTMVFYIRRASKQLHSEFLYIDYMGWLIGGSLSLALCISFVTAMLLSDTKFSYLIVYADPVILIILSLLLIQIPLRTIWRAIHEVFWVAPISLDKKVHAIMDTLLTRYGFVMYETHVAKIGRAYFIEINIVTQPNFAREGVAYLDNIREEIATQLQEKHLKSYLTITFTANKKWL